MLTYIAIFIGGCLGSLARYSLSTIIEPVYTFPYETLLVNLLGCFILTFFVSHPQVSMRVPKEILVGFGTGVIGSFTTFSTFTVETLQLWQSGIYMLAILYVALSVVGGLSLSWLGFKLGRWGEKVV